MPQAQGAVGRYDLIRERLGRPDYAALFAAVRRRLEEAGERAAKSVTLVDLSDAERRAVADLHGWHRLPGGRVRLSLPKLDESLRRSAVAAGLVEVVEALGGPLVDRRAGRQAALRSTEQLWTHAARHHGHRQHPELASWLEELRARGLLRRLARAGALGEAGLLEQALEVVARLPARKMPLSVLAAEVTGDAHALDPGRPLAPLVLRAAARLVGWSRVPGSATARRRLWAEVGVLCDPLSAHVLMLGLAAAGTDRLGRQLRESAEAGEPRRVTLRELAGSRLVIEPARTVFICENPVVVAAAADRLGPRSAPLVCVEGVPSTAASQLLRGLLQGGAHLCFHADFDWAGIRIGNLLAAQLMATAWRFASGDYEAALAGAPDGVSLKGAPVRAVWDPRLQDAMRAAGRAIFEEQVLDSLLADLAG